MENIKPEITVFEGGGMKEIKGKLNPLLISPVALEELIKILDFGAKEYSEDSWKGVPYVEYIKAIFRHLLQIMFGKYVDDKSGFTHFGHIMCNAMFLIHFFYEGKIK